ncbi:MAG: hypothetical protein DI536_36510, partial [Archangium gephyra]
MTDRVDTTTDTQHDAPVAPKRSPLHAVHEVAGATFTDFGGWLMPVRYDSDLAEHHAVRSAAGLFDISHMAELAITGQQAAAFLDAALAANVSAIPLSRAKYTMILEPDGGVIDDLIVYHNAPGEYLVVANAGNRDVVVAELAERIRGFDASLHDGTEAYISDLTRPLKLLLIEAARQREIAWLDMVEEFASGASNVISIRAAAMRILTTTEREGVSLLLDTYHQIEQRIWLAIAERFHLAPELPECVKRADMIALATEKRDLLPEHPAPWECLEGY